MIMSRKKNRKRKLVGFNDLELEPVKIFAVSFMKSASA